MLHLSLSSKLEPRKSGSGESYSQLGTCCSWSSWSAGSTNGVGTCGHHGVELGRDGVKVETHTLGMWEQTELGVALVSRGPKGQLG